MQVLLLSVCLGSESEMHGVLVVVVVLKPKFVKFYYVFLQLSSVCCSGCSLLAVFARAARFVWLVEVLL